jgi:KDO2-lipid IV(A) lauroyltransferase
MAESPVALRAGLAAAAGALHLLGERRYALSDAVANATFALQPARRSATIRNYRAVFPALSRRQARQLAARSFREYARSSLDFVYVHRLPRHRLMGLCRDFGAEPVRRMQAEGRGGIMVLTHFGAWDAGGAWAAASGFPVTAVMADEGGGAVQELVIWARAELGIRVVVASQSARTLLQTLHRGGWVAVLADLPGDTPALEVDFLGHRTLFSAAPTMLAARTGVPLVAVVASRNPAGGYLIEVQPPHYVARDADPATALAPLLTVFEKAIRRWPEQWYPFGEDRLLDLAGS